jgi:hypothetical protein
LPEKASLPLCLVGFLAFDLREAFSEPPVQEAPKEGLGLQFDPLLSFSSFRLDVLWHSPSYQLEEKLGMGRF